MTTDETKTNLAVAQELFAFLQEAPPEGTPFSEHMPRLTPDQAWTVIEHMIGIHREISHYIERCDVCGDLYDSTEGGASTEGPDKYYFCDSCAEIYVENCQLCDCDFNHPEKPEDFRFVVNAELAEHQEIKPGLYAATGLPFFSMPYFGPGFMLDQHNIRLIKEMTIDVEMSGPICPECAKKLTEGEDDAD